MPLPQSPPTTSGIVVLSGSNLFDPQASDFPVIAGTAIMPDDSSLPRVLGLGGQDITDGFPAIIGIAPASTAELPTVKGFVLTTQQFTALSPTIIGIVLPFELPTAVDGVVLDVKQDVGVTSTEVTTSGIVIFDMFPGAGVPEVPFVPPVVINARLFPLFQGPFTGIPDGRIYPVLPQSSTLTPGD
jgi:hypothetical protein